MRKALIAVIAAASTAAIAATSDYYLKIDGISQPAPAGPIYLKITSSGDLDGDGKNDEGVLRIICAGGHLRAAHFNSTFTVDNWAKPSANLTNTTSYDIKKVEGTGARMTTDGGGWTQITFSRAGSLCSEAQAAASAVINTSRSNIKN